MNRQTIDCVPIEYVLMAVVVICSAMVLSVVDADVALWEDEQHPKAPDDPAP